MAAARKELNPRRFQEIGENLLSDAMANQDKAGRRKPHELANHRAQLLRVSVLSEHSPTVTSKNWELLMGKPLSRRMIPRHLADTRAALKRWE